MKSNSSPYLYREIADGGFLALQEISKVNIDSSLVSRVEGIEDIKSERRIKELLGVRNLIDLTLGSDLLLKYRESGAPYLEGLEGEISISHSANYVALLFHPKVKVGVDVESIERDFSRVKSRFLVEREREWVCDSDNSGQLAICWAAKEALFKKISTVGLPFSKIVLEPFNLEESGSLEATYLKSHHSICYIFFADEVVAWTVG